MRARWNRALQWFAFFKNGFVRIQAQWRMPSGSDDSPGDEIRSIILCNTLSADGWEIIRFTWKRAALNILSSRLFMRLIREARRGYVFQPVDKSAESCPIFSPAAKAGPPGRFLLYDIAHLPRAKRIHRPGGCTVRMTPTWTSTRAGIRDIWTSTGQPAESETTIYNVDRESCRSLNSLAAVCGVP